MTILPLFLMMVFCLTLLLMDMGRATSESDKSQIVADHVLLSVLNARADSLQEFAAQQSAIESLIQSAGVNAVKVPRRQWANLATAITKSKNALSGYKGRLTSIISVLMDANGRQRDELQQLDATALKINVEPQNQWVIDETGAKRLFTNLWYRRQWEWDDLNRMKESAEIALHTPVSWHGLFVLNHSKTWTLTRRSRGTLVFDGVSEKNGYPRVWSDCISDGKFRPYQEPYFNSTLRDTL